METYPTSETLEVIKGKTIYKTDKWWFAVLLLNSFGRRQVATYLWLNQDGTWKRKQKFVVQNKKQWNETREIIDEFVIEL